MASIQPVPFSGLLKRLRLAADFTQEELAEKAHLSVRAISQLERGVRQTPRKDTLALLAQALQLSDAERSRFFEAARLSNSLRSAPTLPSASGSAANGSHHAAHLNSSPADNRLFRRPPLVGRTPERQLLERHLAEPSSISSTPPLLVLAGEPGIGKSRLLDEALHSQATQNWTVLSGGCHRKSGQEPYAPLVGALERFLARRTPAQQRQDLNSCAWLVRLLPELRERAVVPAPACEAAGEQERRLMFAAVGRFLLNVAGPAGTLLVLDDLQWAGEDALYLLASLLRIGSDCPIRVLAAYRDSEVQPTDPLAILLADLSREGLAVEVPLHPLDASDAQQLLGEVLRMPETPDVSVPGMNETAFPSDVRAQVLRSAGGIPYFLISCAELLRTETQAGPPTTGWSGRSHVPRDVRQTIRQRVAMLPDAARELLGIAAIAGRETPRRLLLEIAQGLGQTSAAVVNALEATCQARLLIETASGAYQFAHDLIREVVAADVSSVRRATLHLRLAQALEHTGGEPPAELLAYHYARSDDHQRAVTWLERAGDNAFAAHANADAAASYGELAGRLPADAPREDVARAHEKLGAALRILGRDEEALGALQRADALYAHLGDVHSRTRVIALLADHRLVSTPQEGLRLLQPVIEQLEREGPSAGLARLYERQTAMLWASNRDGEALAAVTQAVCVAQTCADERALVSARIWRGTLLYSVGRDEDARRVLLEQATQAHALGDLESTIRALVNASMACLDHGDFTTSRAIMERAVDVAEHFGDPIFLLIATISLALVAFYMGEWNATGAHADEAISLSRRVGARAMPNVADGLTLRGTLQVCRGDIEAGYVTLKESVSLTENAFAVSDTWTAQTALAEFDLLCGHPQQARDRLVALLSPPGHHEAEVLYFLPLLAWAFLDLGEHAEAQRICMDVVGRARALGHRLSLAEGLRAQALVEMRQARWAASRSMLGKVLRLVRSMGYPYMEAKLLYTYGLAEHMAGEPERARVRLQDALAICERLGERLYRAHIEQRLAEPDERAPRSPDESCMHQP